MTDIVSSDINSYIDETNFDFSGKRVLITGASGIIGNYIQTYLSKLPQGHRPESVSLVSKTGQFPFAPSPTCLVENIDLTHTGSVAKLDKYDSIFHAAGYGQPGKFLANEVKTIALNTWVTEALIEKTNPGGDFVFFSSSEVYAENPKIAYSETDIGQTNTDHPRAAYIEGKRLGETLTHIAAKHHQLSAISLRIALIYGPGSKSDDERVLYTVIRQALENRQVQLRDSGSAIRTYGYVLNALSQIISAVVNGTSGIYNVGGNSKLTIRELAQTVCDLTDSKLIVPVSETAFLKDAPKHVELDLTKVLELPGQIPFIGIEDGLQRTIQSMRSN